LNEEESMSKKLIFICLALAVAAMSVPVQGFIYSKPGISDRWETVEEVQAQVDAHFTCGNQISHVITTGAVGLGSSREQVSRGSREAYGMAFLVPSDVTDTKLVKIAFWGDAVEANTPYTNTLHLYDMGVVPPGEPPNIDYNRDNDLLGGVKWVYDGWSTKQVVDFLFDLEDVTIIPGHEYVFEFTLEADDGNGGGFYIERRNGVYPEGCIYSAQYVDDPRSYLYGGSNREAEMAVYLATPEPATIALLSGWIGFAAQETSVSETNS